MNRDELEKISEKLTFKKESLDYYLIRYEKYLGYKHSWHVWLSIVVTMFITFISSEMDWIKIKEPFEWVFYTLFVVFSVFFVQSLYCAHKMTDPASELRRLIFTGYINKPDINCLFLVKHAEAEKILVYRCKTWNCYFLPYVGIRNDSSDFNEESLKKNIADLLNFFESEIAINKLLKSQVTTEKYHPQERVVKEYHTHYYHLYSNPGSLKNDICKRAEYVVGNKVYEWRTLDELEADERTVEKNGDVLKVIRENRTDFIIKTSSFS